MNKLVIVGCGGFGREVLDVVEAINAKAPTWKFAGFIDDSPSETDARLVAERGYAVLGGLERLKQNPELSYSIGIGNGATRQLIDEQLTEAGLSAAVLIHPSATIGGQTELGPGTVLCAGVRLTTNVSLGRHVHVNLNSTVGHDCAIDSYVTVNPLVAISGRVRIGRGTLLGTHSSVLQGLTIGAEATVGAAACVVRDVSDEQVVKGVPAR